MMKTDSICREILSDGKVTRKEFERYIVSIAGATVDKKESEQFLQALPAQDRDKASQKIFKNRSEVSSTLFANDLLIRMGFALKHTAKGVGKAADASCDKNGLVYAPGQRASRAVFYTFEDMDADYFRTHFPPCS